MTSAPHQPGCASHTDRRHVVVRPATQADLDGVLELLTKYEQPRCYFAPWYESDPSYHPEQSWLLHENGRLVAHVRLYLRTMRIGGIPMPIAGIGNVITAKHARGRGYADQLLRAALAAATADGFAYSLLWTHLPRLYQRHGYGSVPDEALDATAPVTRVERVRAATDDDTPAILAHRDQFDAGRSGPSISDLGLWCGARRWLRDELLVATDNVDGGITGYVSYRPNAQRVEILELGIAPHDTATARELLAAAARPAHGRLRAVLPPTLRPVLGPWSPQLLDLEGLMGRPLSVSTLADTLSHTWPGRLTAAGRRQARVPLALPDGTVTLLPTRRSPWNPQRLPTCDHSPRAS